MTDSLNEQTASGPGERLKTARIQKQLSVEQVADLLHLRPSIVVAIEEDDYEQLPGTTFLKGYIRSYSRLVGLSESDLIDELDFRLDIETDHDMKESVFMQEKKGKKLAFVFVTFIVIIVILGIAIKEWPSIKAIFGAHSLKPQPEVHLPKDSTTPSTVSKALEKKTEKTSSEPVISGSDQKKTEQAVGMNPVDQTERASSEKVTANTTNAAATKPTHKTANQHQSISQSDRVSSASLSKVHSPIDAVNNKSLNTETQSINHTANVAAPLKVGSTKMNAEKIGSIQVRFVGDCWFQMTNGSGKTVFADLKHEGDTIDYKGPLPFSFVIGAADKVSITYNDKLVDINQYRIRNNRTAFELN
jgi:cytoskeleton protein RodZ